MYKSLSEYIADYERKRNGDLKVVVRCAKCEQEMTGNQALRVGKKGRGTRYYKCTNSSCQACGKDIAVDVEVVKVPNYIFVPDYEDIITSLIQKAFIHAEAIFEKKASTPDLKPILKPRLAGSQIGYRIRRRSTEYDLSKRLYADDRSESEVKERLAVDDIIDEAIKKALTIEEKNDLLRALFYAAYGQQDPYYRGRASRRSQLGEKTKMDLTFEYAHDESDPQIVEYVSCEKLSKKDENGQSDLSKKRRLDNSL